MQYLSDIVSRQRKVKNFQAPEGWQVHPALQDGGRPLSRDAETDRQDADDRYHRRPPHDGVPADPACNASSPATFELPEVETDDDM